MKLSETYSNRQSRMSLHLGKEGRLPADIAVHNDETEEVIFHGTIEKFAQWVAELDSFYELAKRFDNLEVPTV